MEDEVMVLVEDGYKKYGSDSRILEKISGEPTHLVLAGINLTVTKGTIYTLLGPSGCGKTTLLSCIVGLKTLNKGKIKLGIKTLSQIGYMPQEVGLQQTLSIEENVEFYANLFQLTRQYLDEMKSLYRFLQLPSEKGLVSHMSGGQQRRLSLFITLLHRPDLLILDEPTVGLDPAISHGIWEYFVRLANVEKKTIIITTHYIEEARKAHKIGMMRKGVILEEGNPQQLMIENDVESLDDLFLKVSLKQVAATSAVIQESFKATDRVNPPIEVNKGFSLIHSKTQFLHDINWSKRNKEVFVILLLLPLINCFLYHLAVGRLPDVTNVGLINEDVAMRGLCMDEIRMSCDVHNITGPMSCGYISEIEKYKISLVPYRSVENATEALLRSNIIGYIHIPLNFTQAFLYRTEMSLYTDDDDLTMSLISIQMDMTNKFFADIIKQDLRKAFLKFYENFYSSCNWPVAAAGIPINMKEPIYGDSHISFTDFTLPTIVELSAYFLPFIHIVSLIGTDKSDCIWDRFLVSGMTFAEVLTGHLMLCLSVLVLQITLMLTVMFGIMDNILNGSLILYATLTFIVGVSGLSFGTFASILCKNESAAALLGFGSFFPFTLVCGMIWPYEGMHYLLQKVCRYLPLSLTTDAYRAITIKGWDISEPAVYDGFIISVLWILFYCSGSYGIIVLKRVS